MSWEPGDPLFSPNSESVHTINPMIKLVRAQRDGIMRNPMHWFAVTAGQPGPWSWMEPGVLQRERISA